MEPAQRTAACGSVERGEEAIAGRVHLRPLVAGELPSHARVVGLHELLPRSVAELGHLLGGADDVGEQDGGERALELRLFGAETPDEPLDLVEHPVVLADPEEVLVAGELHQPRPGDPVRLGPHLFDREVEIAGLRDHEGRDVDRRERVGGVDRSVHPGERDGGSGARRSVGGTKPAR